MKIFKVFNVKCGGCASTLISKLKDEFGEIKVNLEVEPREITLFHDSFDKKSLRAKLITLGYPMIDEKLSTFQRISTKGKSFVSCAIGKIKES